ncbi:hypothetical protein [Oceanicella actignis]|uniref:Uncharacterized protein n=1 Tax=Oceanicella actignis TaxID=1189325 RepID=A0A1M7SAP6_9RHOB|nr:hypothetical protein [Oceanicella actignis]SET29014.1 hypothetical protein SAMN04488119_103366 [Oceanicella actignis]SHN55546.1 hypothetical protein SAMN05216200_102142 [Oceanicella actignis]
MPAPVTGRIAASLLAAALAAWGCAPARTTAPHAAADPADAPLLIARAPALFVSDGPEHDGNIAQAAAAHAHALRSGARRARKTDARHAPLIFGAPEGRAFLTAPAAGRALAIGAPPPSCPARAASAGASGDDAQAGMAALAACRAQLRRAGREDGCGCALIAVGDALTAPPDAYAYAPGAGARVLGPAWGLALTLASREEPAAGGARRLTFHPAPGERLRVLIRPDDTAEAELRGPDGPTRLTGSRRALGLERGRFAEVLTLRDPRGRPLVVAAGLAPPALETVAAATLRRALRR